MIVTLLPNQEQSVLMIHKQEALNVCVVPACAMHSHGKRSKKELLGLKGNRKATDWDWEKTGMV